MTESRTDVDNPKELTVLSLCAGYGGLELGLARALENPLRVVAVEIEAYALANLEAKAEQGLLAIEALWPDLKTFPAERFRGCFDFILAGYPCQPFSHAGKRQGEDDPRHLWPHIAAIVSAVQPVWCFFENVAGHLSLGFPSVYRSLRDMDYQVEAGLFTAAECGASIEGRRLFVLAQTTESRDARGNGARDFQWRNVGAHQSDYGEQASCKAQGCFGSPWPPGPGSVTDIPGMVARPPYWVDRLNLAGNGVVPAQAELAFRTLWNI